MKSTLDIDGFKVKGVNINVKEKKIEFNERNKRYLVREIIPRFSCLYLHDLQQCM